MSTQIPNLDALVSFVEQFTGSTNDAEIMQCIYMFELRLRNIELPCQRTDPYTTYGVADNTGSIPIPADMYKPILFFKQGNGQVGQPGAGQQSSLGPWIVYDRIGDRDMISDRMIQQLYLQPVNIPAIIRGKFSEVGGKYLFLPLVTQGQVINLYYYMTWLPLGTIDPSTGDIVTSNGPFQSFNEGYVFGTLAEYYRKRHMAEDAALWDARFEQALREIQDENSLGRWSGGHNRLYSIFQPRRNRQYQVK